MNKKLYVGNLGFSATESDLQQWFAPHGSVLSARIVMDRDTNQSKGFGFVEMATEGEAEAAIAALNGKELGGRTLKVHEAKNKTTKPAAPLAEAAISCRAEPCEEVVAAPGNAPW